jgi:hypothetical protein
MVAGEGEEEEELVEIEEEEEQGEDPAQLARNWEVGRRGRVAGSGMEPGAIRAPRSGKGNAGGGGCCCLAAPAAERATDAAAAWR